MVEHQTLRLMPWTWTAPVASAPESLGRVRYVCAVDVEQVIGFVRCVRGPSWLGCGPQRLEVCETEDASLLMTLEQCWFGFGRWQVIDAERCCVGEVVGSHLLDDQGFRFATIWHEAGAAQVIRGHHNVNYARLETRTDGVSLVSFSQDVDANPYLRMVLLGACVLRPTPAPA